MFNEEEKKKPLVILRSLETGERFFTTNVGDPTKLHNGTVGYTVLKYCDTAAECQKYLFGRSFIKENE
jgi:hypothetical protein